MFAAFESCNADTNEGDEGDKEAEDDRGDEGEAGDEGEDEDDDEDAESFRPFEIFYCTRREVKDQSTRKVRFDHGVHVSHQFDPLVGLHDNRTRVPKNNPLQKKQRQEKKAPMISISPLWPF